MSSSLLFPGSAVPMPNDAERKTMSAIVDYALASNVQEVLGYYLKKVILEKPEDVVGFLLEQIESDPWKPEEEKKADE